MAKVFFSFLAFITFQAKATYYPLDNATLNYTQIMFEFDEIENATNYILTISPKQVNQPPIVLQTKSIAILVKEGLHFGKGYTWVVEAYNKSKKIYTSTRFHFFIAYHPNISPSNIKFTVLKAKMGAFSNDILFIDHLGIAINRKGQPVWFMPDRNDPTEDKNNYRSLQMTPEGSLTFLYNSNCYETDLYGNTIWQSPNNGSYSGDATEYYHHDFAKSPFNGYLCASYKFIQEPNYFDAKRTSRVRYNTLLEYDKYGNILWSWNEKDHIAKSILFQQSDASSEEVAGTHLNGFIFQKKENALLLSFRNTSQVYKIDFYSGKVLYLWDGKKSFAYKNSDITFSQQHGPSLTSNNEVIVYNNNLITDQKAATKAVFPTVQIFSNPTNSSSKLLWEYECTWNKEPEGIQSKEGFAKELSNKNILVNIGGRNRIFEVNRNKEIVWDCSFFKIGKDSNKFVPFSNYRCYETKSLYPIYFTLQKSTKSKSSFVLTNNGSSDDSYNVKILTEDGTSEIANNINITCPSNATKYFDCSPYLQQQWKKIQIVVTSKTNKNFEQKMSLQLN